MKKPTAIFAALVIIVATSETTVGERSKRQIGFGRNQGGGSSSSSSSSSSSRNNICNNLRRSINNNRNSNRGVGLRGGFGSQGKVTNLRDFLSSENVKTPTVTDTSLRFFGTGGSKHGSQCTDSCGNSGKCSYIADSQCQPVLQNLFDSRTRAETIQYILAGIRSPCGFEGFDFTVCCPNAGGQGPTTSRPTTQRPTTQRPTTQPPSNQDSCGITTGIRIVNGVEARPGSWPWQVVLGQPRNPNFFSAADFRVICGGTLISPSVILTAAHCFTSGSSSNTPTHARMGEHDITTSSELSGTVQRRIQRTVLHEGWDKVSLVNDIALVKISGNPLTYTTRIRAACLPFDYQGVTDTSIQPSPYVTGFGALEDGQPSATKLFQAKVPVVGHEACRSAYSGVRNVRLTRNHICAGQGNADTCAGDSGGPMLSDRFRNRWSVIGITSYGVSCANAQYPGVYTRVDRYLDWISSKLKSLEPSQGSTRNFAAKKNSENKGAVRFG